MGNRVCVLSNPKHPHLYLFSSPLLCPEWPVPPKPKRVNCCYGDGPGSYYDPNTERPYCGVKCAKRLREEHKPDLSISLLAPPVHVKEEPPALPALPRPSPKPALPTPPAPRQFTQPAAPPAPAQPVKQPPAKPPKPAKPLPPQPLRPLQPTLTKNMAPQLPRPLRVSLTTPQGELLQYELNMAKTIYINSQAVNVPVNMNQVYYLQTDVNGEKTVQPHLMTGSNKFTDGNVYYCMVPMVLVPSLQPKKSRVCLKRVLLGAFLSLRYSAFKMDRLFTFVLLSGSSKCKYLITPRYFTTSPTPHRFASTP